MINQIKYLIPPQKIWSWGAKKSQPRTGNKKKEGKEDKEGVGSWSWGRSK